VEREADVVVVGGGVTGLAAARALAQAGLETVLLEQFAIGNSRGSSHGASRIFRLAYTDPRFVRLAQDAREGWRALEDESGERLVLATGSLDIGAVALEIAAALETCDAAFELLDGSAASKRWPLALDAGEPVLYHPDGGVLLADRVLAALFDGARAAGATLLEDTRVAALRDEADAVVLELDDRAVRARVAVVAAGGWARDLLAPLGIALDTVATRETVSYFALAEGMALPTVVDWSARPSDPSTDDGRASYGLAAPGVGFKAGLHRGGSETDPELPGEVEPRLVEWTAGWIARRLPDADPVPLASETCIYTIRPDLDFVLERHGRIVVASACSGHGFKFAPVLGETIAGLVSQVPA
jgi:sarcosine oxidase